MIDDVFADEGEASDWLEFYGNAPCDYYGGEYWPQWLSDRWVEAQVAPWDARL